METSKKQLVWLPHEVVLQQGRRVPYRLDLCDGADTLVCRHRRRSEGAARYRNVWEKDRCKHHVRGLPGMCRN